MKITVLIPTYRRSSDLLRCLYALTQQTRSADEVMLVVRDTDIETQKVLETLTLALPIRSAIVSVPGQVAALNVGLDNVSGDIIAIVDDDAVPHPQWLERIATHFIADESVGAVGGRDWVYHGEQLDDGAERIVGKVLWFGKTIGNHHIGIGSAREVDILKGANMSYRRSAIASLRFDSRLRGTGAQVHNDLGFSLAVRKQGWKLIYDPIVAVNHYPAQRFDEDGRNSFSAIALVNAAHNETLILLDYLPSLKRIAYVVWAITIGSRAVPGFIQLLRFLPIEGSLATKKWLAALHGRWEGYQAWKKYQSEANASYSTTANLFE